MTGRSLKICWFRLAVAAFLLFSLGFQPLWAQQPGNERPRRAEAPPRAQTPPQPPPDDDEVVRVDTSLTNVLFTAVDKDKHFFTALGKNDLAVYENDVRQEIFTFQRETNLPLTLVLLIDVTRSQENTLSEEKAAANVFIDTVLRPQLDQASVVSFAEAIASQQESTDQRTRLHDAVDRIEVQFPPEYKSDPERDPGCDVDPRGCTAIWDSLSETVKQLLIPSRIQTRRAIILLTDGEDTASKSKREQAAEFAVKNDTAIYAIGIGDRENYSVKEKDLRRLAERTGGRAFFPRNAEDLRKAFAQIQEELRSQYLLAYAPSNGVQDGSYRKIRIEPVNPELKKQKLRLLYREGYYARQN